MTLVIGIAAVVAGCAGEDAVGPGASLPSREGVVAWVDDGDTIEVEVSGEDVEVRLVAVNAPDQGECHADQALDHLVGTLRDRTVRLEVVGEDQFGRALAHVFDGRRHVNLEMVELGLAIASTPDEADPYAGAILEAEEEAFRSGFGLWAAHACGDDPLPAAVIEPERSNVDPDGPDDSRLGDETVAIYNMGPETIDLSGWHIRDESTRHRFTFPPSTELGPGERLVVASSDPGWDPGQSAIWNNDGDMALLQTPEGNVVSRWRY